MGEFRRLLGKSTAVFAGGAVLAGSVLISGVAVGSGGPATPPPFPAAAVAPSTQPERAGQAGQAGQEEEQAEALAAVQAFFDGLGAGVEALRETRLDEGLVTRLRERDGEWGWEIQTFAEMDAGLAANDAQLLERMWDATVLVHGPLAQVWTPYDFYVDGEFSHCGVDSFTLIKTPEGWTVSSVAYTVEMTGCEPSPLGPPRR